jgi:hypothetical protein
MASLNRNTATLRVSGGGVPTVVVEGGAAGRIACACPGIAAGGSVVLAGSAGESLAGWALGYIQLKFIATDYARYRGQTVAEGSVRVTRSNQILCRDTDESSPELWYDPIAGGMHGARGTRVLPAGTVIPPSGEFVVSSGFADAPRRFFEARIRNAATGVDNFAHHVDIALHFCTMLTAREPGGRYHVLKHFYWNVRWEAHFQRAAGGNLQLRTPAEHLALNIQHHVHSGVPNDPRFRGRELDPHLPVSNNVSRRPAHVLPARDWSQG